jgi:hypothetical protein
VDTEIIPNKTVCAFGQSVVGSDNFYRKERLKMVGWSNSVESPDPRFEITEWGDHGCGGYAVSFSEEDEQGEEMPNYAKEMPNGEECADFHCFEDAVEFVKEIAKCLQSHTKLKWLTGQSCPMATPRLRHFKGFVRRIGMR